MRADPAAPQLLHPQGTVFEEGPQPIFFERVGTEMVDDAPLAGRSIGNVLVLLGFVGGWEQVGHRILQSPGKHAGFDLMCEAPRKGQRGRGCAVAASWNAGQVRGVAPPCRNVPPSPGWLRKKAS